MQTKREVELELALWQARAETAQMTMQAINLQAQMLKTNAQEIQTNIARCQADLASINAATPAEETPGAPEAKDQSPAVEPATA